MIVVHLWCPSYVCMLSKHVAGNSKSEAEPLMQHTLPVVTSDKIPTLLITNCCTHHTVKFMQHRMY